MVNKPDPSRDYYGDLGCPTSADQVEIKKAFKKLALKWHPDRNRGNEVEANSKFQDLQQAHEILTDPEQRAKYDSDRIKFAMFGPKPTTNTSATAGTRPEPPPRTPKSPMYTGFPPPPRRTQPPPFPGQKPAAGTVPKQPQPAMGANRYGAYKNFDRSQREGFRNNADAQSKSAAWDQMRQNGDRKGTNYPPPPRRTKQFADGKTGKQRGGWESDTPTPPRPNPQYAKKPNPQDPGLRRANTTAQPSPRKPTFFNGPAGGEEQPAANTSAYYNVSQGRRPQATRPQSWYPGAQPPPTVNVPPEQPGRPRVDPNSRSWKAQSMGAAMGGAGGMGAGSGTETINTDRLSTPYATAGGEKTYFSNDHFARSSSHSTNLNSQWNTSSARTSPRSPGPASNNRHRSASPSFRSPYPEDHEGDELSSSSSTSCSSDADDEPDEPAPRPKLNPKGPSGRYRQANAQARPHPVYPQVRVEDESDASKTFSAHGTPNGENGMNDQLNFFPQQPRSRQTSNNDLPGGFGASRAKNPRAHPPPSPLSAKSADGAVPSKPLEKSKSWQDEFGPSTDGRTRFERPSTGGRTNPKPEYDIDTFLLRSFDATKIARHVVGAPGLNTVALDTFQSPAQPTSAWPYWAIPSSLTPEGKTLKMFPSSARIEQDQEREAFEKTIADTEFSSFFIPPTDSSSSATPLRDTSSEGDHTSTGKFSGDDLKAKLGRKVNDPGLQNGSQTTPRGRSPPKREAAQNVFTRSMNGEPTSRTESRASSSVDGGVSTAPFAPTDSPQTAKAEGEDWAKHFKPPTFVYTSPEKPKPAGNGKRSKTPRKMSTASKKPPTTTVPKPATVTEPEQEAPEILSSRSSSSAMDVDPPPMQEARIKTDPIADIIRGAIPPENHTADQHANNDDTINLRNFKNTAPFNNEGLDGTADMANSLPIDPLASSDLPTKTVTPLHLEIPKKPKAPVAPDVDTMSSDQWKAYTVHFAKYLLSWNHYSARMLAHFQTRIQKETELPTDLFVPSGNTSFAEYQSSIEEDIRVRNHWEVASRIHRDAVKEMGERRLVAVREHLNDE